MWQQFKPWRQFKKHFWCEHEPLWIHAHEQFRNIFSLKHFGKENFDCERCGDRFLSLRNTSDVNMNHSGFKINVRSVGTNQKCEVGLL